MKETTNAPKGAAATAEQAKPESTKRGKSATSATNRAAQAAAEGRQSANITMADLAASFRKPATAGALPKGGTPTAAGNGEGSGGGVGAEDESAQGEGATGTEVTAEEQAGAEGSEVAGADAADAAEGQEGEEVTAETDETQEGEGEQEQEQDGAKGLEKAHRKALKRIDSLTKRLRTLESQVAGREEGDGEPPKGGTPTIARNGAEQAFAGHPVISEINASLNVINGALRFADENPDGGEYVDDAGNKKEYTAAQVRTIRRNAEQSRTELLTERAAITQHLRTQHQTAAAAAEKELARDYPKLVDTESEEHVEFQQWVKVASPALKAFPDWKLMIADAIHGRAARLAKAAAAKNGNGQVKKLGSPMTKPKGSNEPPNVVTQAAAGAPRVNVKQKEAQQADEAFQKSGRTEDLAKSFSAKKRARLQPA
jgi:hypothetical protein